MRVLVLALWAAVAAAAAPGARYAFFRSMRGPRGAGGRRVFGGRAAPAGEWGAVCALLDRFWAVKCSGAVVAPRWVLTAAHCVSTRLAYVKYNARLASSGEGDVVPVQYLYRHPEFEVVQRDEGRGLDVTALRNDVGLVRTRGAMVLSAPPPRPVLESLLLYEPHELADEPVEVLGFGRTEDAGGEQLFAARLVLTACERSAWFHVVCATAQRGAPAAGVCAGDSGGPVLYRGTQVAVTSMGPVACAARGPAEGAPVASVFTALRRYAALINATVCEAERALRMARVGGALRSAASRCAAEARLLAGFTLFPTLLSLSITCQ